MTETIIMVHLMKTTSKEDTIYRLAQLCSTTALQYDPILSEFEFKCLISPYCAAFKALKRCPAVKGKHFSENHLPS